jgi:hypothetical protein
MVRPQDVRIGVAAQGVYRHDARMLQAPSHLRFQQETRAALGVVGEFLLDLFEGDGARRPEPRRPLPAPLSTFILN